VTMYRSVCASAVCTPIVDVYSLVSLVAIRVAGAAIYYTFTTLGRTRAFVTFSKALKVVAVIRSCGIRGQY